MTETQPDERLLPSIVTNLRTHEVLTLETAATKDLVEYIADYDGVNQMLREEMAAVQAEILGRMGRDLNWKIEVTLEDGNYVLEGEKPKPSTSYLEDKILDMLREAVATDRITHTAAQKVLRRRVQLTVDVPVHMDVEKLKQALAGVSISTRVIVDDPEDPEQPDKQEVDLALAVVGDDSKVMVRPLKDLLALGDSVIMEGVLDATKVDPVGERRLKVTVVP